MSRGRIALLAGLLFAGLVALVGTQDHHFSKVEIKTEKLADGLFMLQGTGGNIGLSAGPDGAFLIDDQYAPLTDKVLAAIKKVTTEPVCFVVNTHWHGDHTGGNENLGKAGVPIVAHDNVRRRISTEQFIAAFNMKVPASPKAALPVITFAADVTFHLNGDEIRAFHVPPATPMAMPSSISARPMCCTWATCTSPAAIRSSISPPVGRSRASLPPPTGRSS